MIKDFNIESVGYDLSGNKVDVSFSWRTKQSIWFEQ